MEKKLSALIAVSALALGLRACQGGGVLNNPPGKYERTSTSTDSNGTIREQKSSADVSVDAQGKKTAVIKSKTTKDPKGLLNKTTARESTQTIEEK